jgi:hypothetical protein
MAIFEGCVEGRKQVCHIRGMSGSYVVCIVRCYLS